MKHNRTSSKRNRKRNTSRRITRSKYTKRGGEYNTNIINRTLDSIKELRQNTLVILDHSTYLDNKWISIGDHINELLSPFTTGKYLNYFQNDNEALNVQRIRLSGLRKYVFGIKGVKYDAYNRPKYDIEVEKFIDGIPHTKYKNHTLDRLLKLQTRDEVLAIINNSKKSFNEMLNSINSLYFEVDTEEKQRSVIQRIQPPLSPRMPTLLSPRIQTLLSPRIPTLLSPRASS